MIEIKWNKLTQVLNDYADYFINKARQNIIDNNSVATGTLMNTMEKIVEINDNKISVKIKLQDYWDDLENGQRPFTLGIATIKDWIEVKNLDLNPYAVQKKIQKEGTDAHPFFNSAKDETYKIFEQRITYAIEEDIAQWVIDNVNEIFKNYK